jgi:hypothetical protein
MVAQRMKILHILAGMSAESGVAIVATRLAVEQQSLGHQVCVASTGEGEVLKCESSKVLKCEEVLKLEGRTPRQGEADPEQNIEHRTSNIALFAIFATIHCNAVVF